MTRADRRQDTIAKIRAHYASLGIPLDELTDRQIELGVRQLAAAAREAGMTKEAAAEAMRKAVESAKARGEEQAPTSDTSP